jgi:hypothetical protein
MDSFLLQAISRNIYIVIACMVSFTLALVSGGVAVWFTGDA